MTRSVCAEDVRGESEDAAPAPPPAPRSCLLPTFRCAEDERGCTARTAKAVMNHEAEWQRRAVVIESGKTTFAWRGSLTQFGCGVTGA